MSLAAFEPWTWPIENRPRAYSCGQLLTATEWPSTICIFALCLLRRLGGGGGNKTRKGQTAHTFTFHIQAVLIGYENCVKMLLMLSLSGMVINIGNTFEKRCYQCKDTQQTHDLHTHTHTHTHTHRHVQAHTYTLYFILHYITCSLQQSLLFKIRFSCLYSPHTKLI